MRVKDAFRENKNITDPAVVEKCISEGHKNLAIIKRQVIFPCTFECLFDSAFIISIF